MAEVKRVSEKMNLKKLITIGFICIVIGTLSRLFLGGKLDGDISSWLYNVGYSLMIGYGLFANGYVIALVEKRWLSWIKKPVKSVLIAFVITTIYSTLVILFTNWFWYSLIMGVAWDKFLVYGKAILILEYVVLYLITLFFYARAFFAEWRRSILAEEKLKQEAISLQYKVLSNQVNPHFLFNSLNVLNSLIKIDADRAESFVNKLSGFYRNLLSFRGKEIISVEDEVSFVQQYLDLQQVRFGDNIVTKMDLNGAKQHQIIPMTLQLLVENAIKHNQINKENPLEIKIFAADKYLVVENNFMPYQSPVDGEKLGLHSLKERYGFLTDNPMEVEVKDDKFVVRVPLLIFELDDEV